MTLRKVMIMVASFMALAVISPAAAEYLCERQCGYVYGRYCCRNHCWWRQPANNYSPQQYYAPSYQGRFSPEQLLLAALGILVVAGAVAFLVSQSSPGGYDTSEMERFTGDMRDASHALDRDATRVNNYIEEQAHRSYQQGREDELREFLNGRR